MVYQHQSTFQKSIESLYKPLKTKLKPLGIVPNSETKPVFLNNTKLNYSHRAFEILVDRTYEIIVDIFVTVEKKM